MKTEKQRPPYKNAKLVATGHDDLKSDRVGHRPISTLGEQKDKATWVYGMVVDSWQAHHRTRSDFFEFSTSGEGGKQGLLAAMEFMQQCANPQDPEGPVSNPETALWQKKKTQLYTLTVEPYFPQRPDRHGV